MAINKFDLIERTGNVGKKAILLRKQMPFTPINTPLINQFIRSATSIGANYCEATECNSKKDFCNKLAIAKKEAKETMHWIEMLRAADIPNKDELNEIADEVHQLILIFSASIKSSRSE